MSKPKIPRCRARWVVGTLLPLSRKSTKTPRPCNRHATEAVSWGNSKASYCPPHAADVREYHAELNRVEADRTARAEARIKEADENVDDWLAEEPGAVVDFFGAKIRVIRAVRCACGRVLSADEFPEHARHGCAVIEAAHAANATTEGDDE